jgi:peptidoglycan-associated lipoprotein
MSHRFLAVLGLAALLATTSACQNKKGADSASGLKRVHFDSDSASLRPDMVKIMDANSRYLKKHKSVQITVEGHCDERDTNEYNLALGERRADAARDYLVRQGIPANRIRTVSMGEEQPADRGRGESSWYMNRRAEFVRQ